MPQIDYLGHAGFVAEHAGTRVLIDPWFHPAFLASWFPYPDNRYLAETDHRRSLRLPLRVPHARGPLRQEVAGDARQERHRSLPGVPHQGAPEAVRRARLHDASFLSGTGSRWNSLPGFTATVLLDTGHKEDSGLLLDMGGFRFLDLNDCNTAAVRIADRRSICSPPSSPERCGIRTVTTTRTDVMRQKVARVRDDLMKSLVSKCRATQAQYYLPCAGPACFLDPELAAFNDRDATIFPVWEGVETVFHAACPEVKVLRAEPGDRLAVVGQEVRVEPYSGTRPDNDLAAYALPPARRVGGVPRCTGSAGRLRGADHVLLQTSAAEPASAPRLLEDSFGSPRTARSGTCGSEELAEDHVIEGEEPYPPDYTLVVPNRVLRAILDGEVGWEEALLSLRVRLHRDPDVFDSRLMGLLRYGNEPAQTLHMSREMSNAATIERDGLRLQRFCPHGSEDLSYATICDGVIECPRHHWKWDTVTGECIEGGDLKLRVERCPEAAVVWKRQTRWRMIFTTRPPWSSAGPD